MAELFNIQLESDLSEYTTTQTDSGDLYWSGTAELAGTSGGMACLIDDANAIYGDKTVTPNTSGVYRIRFYFDPNGLSMGEGTAIRLLGTRSNANDQVYVNVYYNSSNYQIRLIWYNDAGQAAGGYYTISDAEHYIEIMHVRASSDVASDGSVQLWIDGGLEETNSGEDNWGYVLDDVWFYLNDDGVTWAIATGQEPAIWPEDEIEKWLSFSTFNLKQIYLNLIQS